MLLKPNRILKEFLAKIECKIMFVVVHTYTCSLIWWRVKINCLKKKNSLFLCGLTMDNRHLWIFILSVWVKRLIFHILCLCSVVYHSQMISCGFDPPT